MQNNFRTCGSPVSQSASVSQSLASSGHGFRSSRSGDTSNAVAELSARGVQLFQIFVFSALLFFINVRLSAADLAAPSGDSSIIPSDAKLVELWNDGDFTEGVAVAPNGNVYFSDISRGDHPGRIMMFHPQSRMTKVFCKDSGQSNGLMFNREGQLIAACGANGGKIALCRIEKDGTVTEIVKHFEGKVLNSPNDLVIHPNGSIYFSDPRYVGSEPRELNHMSVFHFDPKTQKLTRVASEITKPNGVILSPDSKTIYVAETNNGEMDDPSTIKMTFNAFPVRKDGTLGKRRVLHDFGDQLGIDGMTVDTEGNIYAAVRSPDRFGIVVFDPTGKEKAYIPTPDLPTNCCFGIGKTGSTLYVTAGKGLYEIQLKSTGYHPATS